jgi:Lipid A 3-O-deacylase (PagL)
VRDNVALTVQAGYMHISSAGIYRPNQGINCVTGMIGITWFF